jgi:hypothetical protein
MTFICKNSKKHSGIKNIIFIKVNIILKTKCITNSSSYKVSQISFDLKYLSHKCTLQKFSTSKSSSFKRPILINPRITMMKPTDK